MNNRKFLSLVIKEVHYLLPLIYALLAVNLLGMVDSFIDQSPDNLSWVNFSILYNLKFSVYSSVFLSIGIIAAYMVFSQERGQGTLSFLWALPIRRYQVFLTKLCAAFLVLAAMSLFGSLLSLWAQSFGAITILQAQFSWSLWWWELGLENALYAIGLCYGALFSYYRTSGILFLLTLWVLTIFLVQIRPDLNFISFEILLKPEFRGTEILLVKKAWLIHSLAALLCLISAGFLWTRFPTSKIDGSRKSIQLPRVVSIALYVGVFLFFISYGAIQLLPQNLSYIDERENRNLRTFKTKYFDISYLQADQGRAQLLGKEADQLSLSVQELLGATFNERILVDLTDESPNHLGIAGWKRLRVGRSALIDPVERQHVFVHESAHVLAAQITDRRLSDRSNYTKFFNEGLAEWVSYQILDIKNTRSALSLLAAAAWHRLDIRFDDFLFWSAFSARFDENLIYALGEAWVSALADVCGEQAPGEVLRAIGRPDVSQRLTGKRFWLDSLQHAHCDLNLVNSRFALKMKEQKSAVDMIPTVVGGISINEQDVRFNLSLAGSRPGETYTVLARVRDNPQTGPEGTITTSTTIEYEGSAQLFVPRGIISGDRFQYQLGVEFINAERPYFGQWLDAG